MAQVFEKLLGENLISSTGEVTTQEALQGKVVGLYFSAHWCPPCRGFTPQLADWYSTSLAAKGFEVVFVSSDRDAESFLEYFKEMPWLALPFESREQKAALSKKFKVQGIPTLVILDSDGSVITSDGRSSLSADPTGEDFPWRPKPYSEMLGTSFVGQGGASLDSSAVAGKVLGLYFSAHWCPPCRKFTPLLAEWYKRVAPALPDFEIVLISSDRSQEAFDEYFAEMPWIALPHADRKRKEQLSTHFEVDGIPTFVIVDKDGTVINGKGRSIPSSDPEGKEFPWHPKPVKDLAEGPEGLQESPSLVVMLDGADATLRAQVNSALDVVAAEAKASAKLSGDEEILFFTGGPDSLGILNQIRGLAKMPRVIEKHEHPLVANPERKNWRCDGCGEGSDKGTAYCCAACDFDYCEACNGAATEERSGRVTGVLLDLSDEGAYYLCDEVDFTNADSLRKYLQQYRSKSLVRHEA